MNRRAIEKARVVVALLSSALAACAFGCATPGGTQRAGQEAARPDQGHDGPIFEGAATGVPGSFGRLVLEKDFRHTRKLRWQSADSKIGVAEVDFFEPRDWLFEGDPPDTLRFRDRSPGPILAGEVRLGPPHRAIVNVMLGSDRVTYMLKRVERAGIDARGD